jgi:hypothetical protein
MSRLPLLSPVSRYHSTVVQVMREGNPTNVGFFETPVTCILPGP